MARTHPLRPSWRARSRLFLVCAIVPAAILTAAALLPAGAHVAGVNHTFQHMRDALAYKRFHKDLEVPAGSILRDVQRCPEGQEVLGGGATVVGEGAGPFPTVLRESAPGTVGGFGSIRDLWLVSIENADTEPHTVRIYAICANMKAG
jgi:hypothetical protein